jgi:hypothetical protein
MKRCLASGIGGVKKALETDAPAMRIMKNW